jgi:hypothetical protein
MPDQPAGGEKTEPTEAVKEHLGRSHAHAHQFHDDVIKALNQFSAEELKAMYDCVGKNGLSDQLETHVTAPKLIICATH